MSHKVWQFVSAPELGATVYLNMNDPGKIYIDGNSPFTLDAPELKQVWANSPIANGSELSASSYGNRDLVFSLHIDGLDSTAKATRMNQLLALISKPGLIKYQLDGTMQPVFFETYPSDIYKVRPRNKGAWSVDLVVAAKPFAIGIRRVLPGATIFNDPASVSGSPLFWDVTGVEGDAEAPVFARISASARALMAWRAGNDPTSLTLWSQAEAGTLGTDATSVVLTDASGGSGVNVSFVTNTLIARATFTLPTATNNEALRGKYRVLVRVKAGAAGSTYLIRYKQNPSLNSSNGRIVTYAAPTTWAVLDLGLIEFPGFPVPEYFGSSYIKPGIATSQFAIEVSRTVGTAAFHMDYVQLIPADEGICLIGQIGAQPWLILDGPGREAYGMATGSAPFGPAGAGRLMDNGAGLVSIFGKVPHLIPGVTNRFWFIRTDSAALTNSETITFYYWPQWKWVPTS